MKLSVRETAVFGMLGAIMYASKAALEFLPNIHLVGVFIVVLTVVYRKKALYPIYTFVLITGFLNGFNLWWIPYLYIWTVLWGAVMLLPRNIPEKLRPVVYMLVCSAHGFLYGTLYAPFQAIAFGMSFEGTIAWIAAGLPWDCVHGISNFVCGLLIMPLVNILTKSEKGFMLKKG